MTTSPRPFRSAFTIKASLALAAATAFIPGSLFAQVSTLGFTDGNGTTSFDQFNGAATGGGWDTAWNVNGTGTSATVINTTPIGSGGNYLSVTSNSAADASINRSFDGTGTGVSTLAAYQVTFSLRLDTLTNFNNTNDYITITDNTANLAGASANSGFIIRAYGATTGTANAMVWSFYNGGKNGGSFNTSLFSSSTMSLVAGTTYSFVIDVDPVSRTYGVSINDGTTSVSATGLGFRKSATSGGDYLIFNTRNDVGTDAIAYSLDNLSVVASAVPEPGTYAALAGFAVLGLAAYRRRASKC